MILKNPLKFMPKLSRSTEALGVLFDYQTDEVEGSAQKIDHIKTQSFRASKPVIGVVGAGNYATRILVPALKKANAQLHTLVYWRSERIC